MTKLSAYRRLWTVLLDACITIAILIIGHYNPAELEFYQALIVAVQPVFVVLISLYTWEDNKDAERQAAFRSRQ